MWPSGESLPFVLALAFAMPAAAPPMDARLPPEANDLQAPAPCSAWTSDYALAARLTLTDTPMGAGDGVYDIGPGLLRLRFTP